MDIRYYKDIHQTLYGFLYYIRPKSLQMDTHDQIEAHGLSHMLKKS